MVPPVLRYPWYSSTRYSVLAGIWYLVPAGFPVPVWERLPGTVPGVPGLLMSFLQWFPNESYLFHELWQRVLVEAIPCLIIHYYSFTCGLWYLHFA